MNKLEKNFVYLHIPKSGGTSITELLFALMEPVYPRERLLNYAQFSDIPPPEKPSLFISHIGYSFYRAAGGYCMTVMRDPVERILSLYSYWKNPGDKRAPGDPLPEGMTLEDFLASTRNDIWTNVRNAQTWQIAFGLEPRVRERLGGIQALELFDIAKKNLDSMHVVGVIERPKEFIPQLMSLFPNKIDLKLERYNQSRERTNAQDVAPETLDVIRGMTELDERLYRYASELSAGRAFSYRAA